jgi:hypothetical protein
MTYGHILKPDLAVGIIDLDVNGVTISNTSPKVEFTSINWRSASSGLASVTGIDSKNITLAANKKYLLQATLSGIWSLPYNDRKFRWYNESNSSWIGKHGICDARYEAYDNITLERIDESARAVIIVGSSNIDISLRYSGTTAQSFKVGDRDTTAGAVWSYLEDYGRIEIWEFNQ